MPRSRKRTKVCEGCGSLFLTLEPQAKYHSVSCSQKHSRGKPKKVNSKILLRMAEREDKLHDLLITGVSSSEIEDIMGASKEKVNYYRRSLYKRLKVTTRVELMAKTIEMLKREKTELIGGV